MPEEAALAPPALPCPRTLARQRRLERESWARRGLGGASPPPRTGASEGAPCGVRVIVRCRPPSPDGDADGSRGSNLGTGGPGAGARVLDEVTVELRESWPGRNLPPKRFSADKAFGGGASTGEVFNAVRDLVRAAARGASCAVVAYGPSGSGKTHTMYGSLQDQGLVPRAVMELLACAAGQPVSVSMLELHNETLVDLLVPRGQPTPHLEVRCSSSGAMATIEGAREVVGESLVPLLFAIRGGLARRQVASTMANATSSRSHVIVVFRVGPGQLMLVDLAGLERVKRSGVEGSLLREAQSINRSLTTLTDVVDALRRGAAHVPARNSRLARLMAGALGGSAETVVVVCVPPGAAKSDEALVALCFAERVRRIRAAASCTNVAPNG